MKTENENLVEFIEDRESFRDSLSTVTKDGKRIWLYPKLLIGRFYKWRTYFSYLLLAFLFLAPVIKINGQPLILLDFINRNFILFSIHFGPQDFHLFVLAMIGLIVFIILFTVIFGRVFCGWACPQTVFMEMVFRKIEYFIEGDASKQYKLNNSLWTKEKILKKSVKHFIFISLSFVIANLFLAYIVGLDELLKIVSHSPAENMQLFIIIIIFSGLFYWVFSWFREQACTIVCPYGRLQGVLLDQDSIVIAYDNKRGEPRGKINKEIERENLGDCIDCKLCVDVCPTGIDIRNGIQLECVNCANCIDACDFVMDKINKPRGLIKYASLNNLEKGKGFSFSPKIISYSAVLVVIIAVLIFFMFTKSDFNINILRVPGQLYQEQPDNKISNLYNINIINKTNEEVKLSLKAENTNAEIKIVGNELLAKPHEHLEAKFFIMLNRNEIKQLKTEIVIGIYSGNEKINSIKTSFFGTIKKESEL